MTPFEVAQRYNVALDVAQAAFDNIARNKVLFLTISGRIGAGKDTVAPRVVSLLGFEKAHHESFAGPLREEVNQVIECIRRAGSFDEAMALVERELACTNHYEVVVALYEDVKAGRVNNSYERTTSTRRALQWWGTEVRRAVDDDYWVKKAMKSSLEKLAMGTSIYVTDSRFPNEASAITAVAGVLIRLTVSPEEQRRRIMGRDGIEPNAEALAHISETAMDTYPFEHIIDTDQYSTDEVIDQACAMVRSIRGLVPANANS